MLYIFCENSRDGNTFKNMAQKVYTRTDILHNNQKKQTQYTHNKSPGRIW